MNAWGVVLIAVGAGVLWWGVKHLGSISGLMSELGSDIASLPAAAAKAAVPPAYKNDLDPYDSAGGNGTTKSLWARTF